MYTFKYPIQFSKRFEIFQPGESKYQQYNLSQLDFNGCGLYSIQALSSGTVEVEVFMSNISLPDNSPLWIPCTSIHTTTLMSGDNFFTQDEFLDACTFLMFKFTAVENNPHQVAVALNICFKGKPKNRKPKPKPHPDEFSLTQGGKLTITNPDLILNDEFNGVLIKDIKVDNPVNGIITKVGNQITYQHTGRYGYPASFTYQLIDEDDRVSFPCMVTINIKMLPEMKGYIFDAEELEDFLNNYTPPTFADIFNSWSRFYNSYYYPSGTTPQGEAAAWSMVAEDQFKCTVNSNYTTGFVSPEIFDYYEHQVDLSSTNSDDDEIHVIIAYARIDNINYTLVLNRESGGCGQHTGNTGFSIMLIVNNTYTVIKSASSNKVTSGSPSANASGYGWNNTSPTRVKIVRNGDIITCISSPFKSLDLIIGETITIDLNDYSQLEWVKGKHSYGYSCFSQSQSTYANVLFSGAGETNAKELYDLDGSVYTYQDGKWSLAEKKIWDIIGYPRIVENVDNKKRYLVEYEKITLINGPTSPIEIL